MEVMKNAINRCIRRFISNQEVESPVTKLDSYFNSIHRIITWQDVDLTLTVLLVVQFIFWVIAILEIQLYTLFCSSMLCVILCHLYLENGNIKSAPGPYSNSGEKISVFIKSRVLYLQKLRRENPAAFCIMMSGLFILLSFISRYLTGLQLLYLVIMSMFAGPLISLKSPKFLEKIFENMMYEGVLDESDLLFDDFEECDHYDIEAVDTDPNTDSLSSLLENELIVMPSHSEVDGNAEELTESKLLELIPKSDSSESSSDNEHKNIKFIPSHFENESSSDEDNYLPQIIPQISTTDNTNKTKETNSDSEFEIIDYIELGGTSTQ